MKKTTMSKILAILSITQFIIVVFYAIAIGVFDLNSEALSILIPSSAALATAATTFYYNKSKIENLSKQKIRGIYLKVYLEGKLTPEAFAEIEEELNNIDATIEKKIDDSYEEAINEDIETN